MYSRRWTPALLFMVLFAMQSTASNAESSTIGVAASIKPNAEAGRRSKFTEAFAW